MEKKIVTVCYPLQFKKDRPSILLGRKKDTPGAQKLLMVDLWNGGGGKLEPAIDTSVLACHARETKEDFGITLNLDAITIVGRIDVRNPGATVDIELNLAFCEQWDGLITSESREMRNIQFFPLDNLPYEEMMDLDKKVHLPHALYQCLNNGSILCTRVVHEVKDKRMRVMHIDEIRFEPRFVLTA
ncbi:MAG TPA: NUDIX domain-containing protein [Candidatus Paceibacterota bacterium]|jgi:NUDIX domain.